MELDLLDELGRFLALIKVDLLRSFAQVVWVAIADKGPRGQEDACARSRISVLEVERTCSIKTHRERERKEAQLSEWLRDTRRSCALGSSAH